MKGANQALGMCHPTTGHVCKVVQMHDFCRGFYRHQEGLLDRVEMKDEAACMKSGIRSGAKNEIVRHSSHQQSVPDNPLNKRVS